MIAACTRLAILGGAMQSSVVLSALYDRASKQHAHTQSSGEDVHGGTETVFRVA
jgi:hypothetical protein